MLFQLLAELQFPSLQMLQLNFRDVFCVWKMLLQICGEKMYDAAIPFLSRLGFLTQHEPLVNLVFPPNILLLVSAIGVRVFVQTLIGCRVRGWRVVSVQVHVLEVVVFKVVVLKVVVAVVEASSVLTLRVIVRRVSVL